MEYMYKGEKYVLNLIDTPGHVDFSYEVSRSIAACEGALLIVDASQGVQAQTISNLYMAIEHDLEIIPVINKIDMPSAMPEEVEDEIVDLIGCKHEDILRASGKTGEGGGCGCTSEGFDLRLCIQFIPWYHRLLQDRERCNPQGRQGEVLQHRNGI